MMSTVDDSLTALVVLLTIGITLALYVWTALALGAMFRKMGDEPWRAWVPVLNLATLLRWGGFSPWLALLVFVPGGAIAVWVLVVIAAHRINPGFGYRGAGMTVLAALLGVVWASILGFGPARWLGARIVGPVPNRRTVPTEPADADVAALFGPAASPAPAGAAAAWAPPPAPSAAVDDDGDEADAAVPGARRAADAAPAAPAAAPASPESEDVADVGGSAASDPSPVSFSDSDGRRAARAAASEVGTRPVPTIPDADAAAGDAPAAADDAGFQPPLRGWAPPPAAAARAGSGDAASADAPSPEPPALRTPEWDTDMDEVSAVAPSMFPPSAAARGTHVAPPVDTSEPIVSSVPGRRSATSQPAAPVTRLPAGSARPYQPARSADHDPDAFPELSGEVSAVVGSPAAGSPLSARRSVSAQQRDEEAPKPRALAQTPDAADDDDLDQTVIARRKRAAWQLIPASGSPIGLTADVAILGRHPAPDPERPKAQLVSIADDTRTVSKTHARLELKADGWHVTDLHSTNGVLLPTVLGTQIEIDAGSTVPAGDVFLLGDAEFRLVRGDR